MQRIELSREIPAPPEAVWEVLADHRGWSRWAGIREAVLRNEGYPPPNGLGATRVFRAHGLAVEEEITAFEPPHRLEYRLCAGAPVRDHRGEIRVEPAPRGARVDWSVSFRPLLPGTGPMLRWLIGRGLDDVLNRLADYPFAPPASKAPRVGSS